MAKIVDIEPSINRFKEIYAESLHVDCMFAGFNLGVAKHLEGLPRIEIQQQTHGNWVRFMGNGSARCSVCGYAVPDAVMITQFCGNCGAKMDGGT